MVDMQARFDRLTAERAQVVTTIASEEAWQSDLQACNASRLTSKFTVPPFCTREEKWAHDGALDNARMRLIEIDKLLEAMG